MEQGNKEKGCGGEWDREGKAGQIKSRNMVKQPKFMESQCT